MTKNNDFKEMEQEYGTKSPSTTPSTTPKPYRKNPKRPSMYVRRASAADIGQTDDEAPEYQKELNRRLSEGRLSMIIRGDELQEDNCYNNFGKLLQNHTFHVRKSNFFLVTVILVTSLVTSYVDDFFRYVGDFLNVLNRSPTS